ncbi:hypothetical protein R3W88_011150 [Solanum pinnatisectum]|uniref:Uncharacterized protein n=1 Tax=Solanum pinnatisectum TaxID=50273 RepID=A0AAV9L6E1_9SOLN|nr:hypothetical protein R3W88_011150 [Solanum pinnatisectum]
MTSSFPLFSGQPLSFSIISGETQKPQHLSSSRNEPPKPHLQQTQLPQQTPRPPSSSLLPEQRTKNETNSSGEEPSRHKLDQTNPKSSSITKDPPPQNHPPFSPTSDH